MRWNIWSVYFRSFVKLWLSKWKCFDGFQHESVYNFFFIKKFCHEYACIQILSSWTFNFHIFSPSYKAQKFPVYHKTIYHMFVAICRDPCDKFLIYLCVVFCLVFRPTRGFFTHMETSPLSNVFKCVFYPRALARG